MQNLTEKLICLCLLPLFPLKTFAATPDFFFVFKECKTVIASSIDPDFPLKVVEGDPPSIACARNGRKAKCQLSFSNPSAKAIGGDVRDYDIVMETANLFDLKLSENGGDYISADRQRHSATITTRVFGENFAGAKVCRGIFVTADEAKILSKKD